ncbi:hypothetical protein FE257_007772 [Aspergillus nanangensis]|uniref:BTB domain-containing protein n=1 Tax=Aspergillus nanangensis TaxID=2582783 RepID=A0AAD4CWZ5_ASPNN|nr:hypothetical protein FE257_007772 [Aspergillus nanangensis]
MEACRDYGSLAPDVSNNNASSLEYSIVHSPPFTFLVGPKHTKLTVQAGLARHVSKPLDHLMNSGQTRESKHHIAVLEDEDVETFVAFCEYAYTGDYSVPPPGSREDDVDPAMETADRESSVGGFPGIGAGLRVTPSNASYLPSPPRSSGTEEKEKDQDVKPGSGEHQVTETEVEAVRMQDQNHPGIESTPLSDDSGFHDSSGPAVPETTNDAADPWDLAGDAAPTKEKKGRKCKKNKKKQTDDQAPNFTPPSTPPPGESADLAAEQRDEWAQPLESPEAMPSDDYHDATMSPDMTVPPPMPDDDSWEQTATPVAETEDEDTPGDDAEENQPVDSSGGSSSSSSDMGPIIDTSFAKQHFSNNQHENGISMWDEFTTLDYIDPRQWSSGTTRPPSVLSHSSRTADLPYLVFHAKVYVFAARYLIPALAQLCLRKLHRDLVNLGFAQEDGNDDHHGQQPNCGDEERELSSSMATTTKAKMVIDLLHYTYVRTTRLEPISPTSATQLRDNELRKLVVHYAACKVRHLTDFCPPMEGGFSFGDLNKASARGMRTLLDTTPELASDLVYRMMM